MDDSIVSLRGKIWAHTNSLIPPPFIEVPVPSQESEWSRIRVLWYWFCLFLWLIDWILKQVCFLLFSILFFIDNIIQAITTNQRSKVNNPIEICLIRCFVPRLWPCSCYKYGWYTVHLTLNITHSLLEFYSFLVRAYLTSFQIRYLRFY